jgi:peptide/nickel transport system permease protein
MLRFILRRLFYGFLVILGVTSLVFFLFNILPGDPARMMLGQRADIASVEAINKDLGRDKPVLLQFVNYLNDLSPISLHNAVESDSYWFVNKEKYGSYSSLIKAGSRSLVLKKPYLRRSYQSKKPVTDIIAEAFPNTAILALTAILIALLLGVTGGVFSALFKDTWFDKGMLLFSVLGMSVPSFFAAILFAWIFAFVLAPFTGLNMVGSLYAVDELGRGEYMDIKNLILPAITLGIRPLAVVVELTRSSMLNVLGQDYIRTAKAKGLKTSIIIRRHALKNSMNPVVTAMSGWLASLMAGAVFVEYVFDWKGIGVVMVEALEKYDFPVLMGTVLFVSVILIFINIFVDILYSFLDPRIRFDN